ncbi:MAG: hypothetical protein HYT09_00520 [Candidatus Levybacteria bacterium]|nr:hypothetical protein [Candidatus Levybacteria bacterium]
MFKTKDWTFDSLYAIRGFAKMYFYRKPPKHYLGFVKDGKYPIVIIPGYLMRWGFMKSIADKISYLGHPVYVLPHLGNNVNDIPTSAKIVNELIEENNLKNIIIVAHSKGGLIGKYLMINLDRNNRITGLVTIGTPHMGSHLANYFKFIKSNEFHPEHDMIKDLSGHPDINKKIITVSPSFDNLVWHEKKGSLDGALENIHVTVSGHHRVVFDKEVKEKVIASIEKLSV